MVQSVFHCLRPSLPAAIHETSRNRVYLLERLTFPSHLHFFLHVIFAIISLPLLLLFAPRVKCHNINAALNVSKHGKEKTILQSLPIILFWI